MGMKKGLRKEALEVGKEECGWRPKNREEWKRKKRGDQREERQKWREGRCWWES